MAWSAGGFLVLVVTFVVMVELRVGQRFDFSAFEGRKWTPVVVRHRVALGVRAVTPVVVVGTAVASMAVAYLRRGKVAAVAAAACAPTVLVLSRFLRAMIDRDDLLHGTWVTTRNTYPSGHVAVLVAVVLVAIAVSPPRWRQSVATAAVVVTTCQILGVAASGWHRPSDLAGALGLAVAVGAALSAVVVGRWRGDSQPIGTGWSATVPGALIGAALLVGATTVWFGGLRLLGGRNYGSYTLHVLATQWIVLLGYGVVVAHTALVSLSDRGSRAPSSPAGRAP